MSKPIVDCLIEKDQNKENIKGNINKEK